MGAKSLYTDTKLKIIEQLRLANDIEALQKLEKDKAEYKKYSKNWQAANLDEFMEKFTITDDTYNLTTNYRKISFFDDGKKYEVVCAVGASYFRVVRKAFIDSTGVKHGDTYVTLDLKEPRIDKNLKGKAAGEERQRLTHFRMTYKKGDE